MTGDRSAVGLTAYVRPFNLSGHPALALPVPSPAGLPASLQLVARHGADALLCAAGRRFEAAAVRPKGEASHA
jgi:amidase